MRTSIILHKLPKLKKATVIKRPSKIIKSPYVADISINGKSYLGHTPALGCCGLVEAEKDVYVYELEGKKCDYRICLTKITEKNKEITIGTAPKMAECITKQALINNLIPMLICVKLAREKKILNSRFDFIGKTIQNIPFILEVKNVPLADYEDIYSKDRKKRNYDSRKWNSKISYFPDGYRKKIKDTVSPRALKHVNELCEIKKYRKNKIRCILLFVIQRIDVSSFQPSRIDIKYLNAIRNAWKNGVEIKTLQVQWINNKAYYYKNHLPINLFDNCNHIQISN